MSEFGGTAVTREQVAIDENISPRLSGALTELYGKDEFEFIPVKSFATAGTADETWADQFKRIGGRVVLSGDINIGKRPRQAAALSCKRVFVLLPERFMGPSAGSCKIGVLGPRLASHCTSREVQPSSVLLAHSMCGTSKCVALSR